MAATTLTKLHATVGQMQKNLECPICLDLLRDPVSTKCDHQFCSFCIQSLLAARKKPYAPCPLCKKSITKRSLTKNERMNEIVSAVRGVADALECDTGIRCTPPKGPPVLSQTSSQSSGGSTSHTPNGIENKPVQKKAAGDNKSRQNVRRARTRQLVQQVQVYIDSDQSDSEGNQVQLVSTNVNISSSFPAPNRCKGKKGRKQPARRNQRNQRNNNEPSNNQVASRNAHNNLLNAIGSEPMGRVDNHKQVSLSVEKDQSSSSAEERNQLLNVLDEGSLGGRSKNDDDEIADEVQDDDTDDLPGNTEIISDIFGVSPSMEIRADDESQEEIPEPIVVDDNPVVLDDDDFTAPPEVAKPIPPVAKQPTRKESSSSLKASTNKENSQLPPEEDPYEFIASQRTPKKVKSKRGRKAKKQATEVDKKTSNKKGGKKTSKKGANNTKVVNLDEDDDTQVEDVIDLEDTANQDLPQVVDESQSNSKQKTADKLENNDIMRIEGLFASQQTNDSVDLNEDRGIPLGNFDEDSDGESVPNSDYSYKPGGGRREDGVNEKRMTRRQRQVEEKETNKNGADENSTSAVEDGSDTTGKSKKYGRSGTRKSKKQNKSDSSASEENREEEEKTEAEVSFIQDHLDECDDVDLYLDGDSQRSQIDSVERHQKLKNVTAQHLPPVKDVEGGDEKVEKEATEVAKGNLSKSSRSGRGENGNTSKADDEPIIVEDNDQEDEEPNHRKQAATETTNGPFKKPSALALRRKKPSSKSGQDYVSITIPSSRIENKSSKVSKQQQQEEENKLLQDPDDGELTLVDSQRERKTRNPNGIFYKSYKRGSVQLDRSLNNDDKNDDDDDEEDDITLADVFGDDADNDLPGNLPIEMEDEIPMDMDTSMDTGSDAQHSDEQEEGDFASKNKEEDVEVAAETATPVDDKEVEESPVKETPVVIQDVESPTKEPLLHQQSPVSDKGVSPVKRRTRMTRNASRDRKPRSRSESVPPGGRKKLTRGRASCPNAETKPWKNLDVNLKGEQSSTKKSKDGQSVVLPEGESTTGKDGEEVRNTRNRSRSRTKKRNDETSEEAKNESTGQVSRNKKRGAHSLDSYDQIKTNKQDEATVKSDWEIALELAREFGTEPKEFRSRSRQRHSDETEMRSTRGSNRRKPELSMSKVSVTTLVTSLVKEEVVDEQSKSENGDVEEIESFSSEGISETRNNVDDTNKGNRRTNRKKKGDKKSSGAKENKEDEEVNKINSPVKKTDEMETESAMSENVNKIKTVIPETPLLPVVNLDDVQENPVVARDSGGQRSLRDARNSSQTTDQVLGFVKDVNQVSADSRKGQTICDSDDMITPGSGRNENDKSASQKKTGSRKKSSRSSPGKKSGEKTTKDVVTKSKDSSGSSDEDVEEVKTSRSSRRRLSGRKSIEPHQESDLEVVNSEEPQRSIESSGERSSRSSKRTQRSKRSGNKTSGTDKDLDRSSSRDTSKMETSGARTLRSRRGMHTSQSSGNESTDGSKSRERRTRSQSRNARKPSVSKELLRKSKRRGKSVVESSDAESTDQETSRSRERVTRSLQKSNSSASKQSVRRGRLDLSDAESTDQETSRSRERISRSQQKNKITPSEEPVVRRSGRSRKDVQPSSGAESTDHETSRERLPKVGVEVQSQDEVEVIQSPVRRSGRTSQSTPQSNAGANRALTLTPDNKDVQKLKNSDTPGRKERGQRKGVNERTKLAKDTPSPNSAKRKTRNSPRLISPAASRKLQKGPDSDVNSQVGSCGTLFSDEAILQQDDKDAAEPEKKEATRSSADVVKGSDTTESIELAVSNELYEEENSDIQEQQSEQPPSHKEDFQPPASVVAQNVTRRRRNKLSRKNKASSRSGSTTSETESVSTASDVDTNTIKPTPQRVEEYVAKEDGKVGKKPKSPKVVPSSCTETETLVTTASEDDTNTVKPTPQTKKSNSQSKQVKANTKLSKEQKKAGKARNERKQLPSVSGSETESLCSPQGSDSDIFRNSDPIVVEGENAETIEPSQLGDEDLDTKNKMESRKHPNDDAIDAKSINTTPQPGSLDAATLGSSLESELMLVPPPSHYQQNFEQVMNDSGIDDKGSRRRSKRKSFALEASPGLDQQSKKRRSEEMDNDVDSRKDQPIHEQQSSGHTSQQKLSGGKLTRKNLSKSSGRGRKGKEQVAGADIVDLDKDEVLNESSSLQTKRRSRLSGSRRGSAPNTPRSGNVLRSVTATEQESDFNTGNVVVEETQSPSLRTKKGQRSPPGSNGVGVTSPRRSPRKKVSQQRKDDKMPSQTKSTPGDDDDYDIANSGSLFGTQNSTDYQKDKASQKNASPEVAKIQNDDDVQNIGDDDEEEEIGGSQCMFGSNPNSSFEQDVEMMSLESQEDEEQDENSKVQKDGEDSKPPHYTQPLYSEGVSGKHQSLQVTTIPESAVSISEAKLTSPSGSRRSQGSCNSVSAGSRKLRSSGSASTCVPASEGASISPDQLSNPIKIVRKSSSGNQSKDVREDDEKRSQYNNGSRRKRDKVSQKSNGSSSYETIPSFVTSRGRRNKKTKKRKPLTLSDIDLSEGDVDGDHDLLFKEEDEVMTLTPVDGLKKGDETKTVDDEQGTETICDEDVDQDEGLIKTSSPCKNSKGSIPSGGKQSDADKDDDEENSDKEDEEEEDKSDGEEVPDNNDEKEDNGSDVEKVDEEEEETLYQEEDNEDDKKDDDESEVDEIDEDDDLIPPTPPCAANTTKSSLSKTRNGSTSFFSSGHNSSSNRTQTISSSSSNSFSNHSSKSFTFKHPSSTHSQRFGKMRNASKPSTRSLSEMPADREKVTNRRLRSESSATKAEATVKEPESLDDESQSLSIIQNGADSVIDLNDLPEKRTSQRAGKGKSVEAEEQQDDDELMACPFLQTDQHNDDHAITDEEDSNVAKRLQKKRSKDGKSSTSDEKDYDTEASVCSKDSSSTSHHLNLTSASSVMSSQSEIMSTQQQVKAHETLMKMQEQIAQIEARLGTDDQPPDDPILASDSDDQAKDSGDEADESETELDGIERLEEDPENEQKENDLAEARKEAETKKKAVDMSGQRQSQKLVYCDEESDDETNLEDDKNDKTGVGQTLEHKMVEPSLDVCPRSPSPPPPLTQGTMQKYTNRSPMQDTVDDVTKLADKFKSVSGSAKSRKRRAQGNDSDSSDDVSINSSNRLRKKRVARKQSQRKLSSESESSDEDVSKSESQRRSVKRRLQSDSDSSQNANRTRSKSARSSKNPTPGSGPKADKNRLASLSSQKSRQNSQDHDRTQMPMVGESQSPTKKKPASSSQNARTLTPHTIENSLPESSRNVTQNTMQERTNPSSENARNKQSSHKSPPASASAKAPSEHRSPLLEMSCKRTLMREESAPVVAKNLRKNGGRFSFVATGLSRQELKEVERLAKMMGCKFAGMFNANTTHVIINTDEDLVCERTLKYFQGIAARVWVVSYSWIEACLKTGDLLPEEGFEVQGDVVNGRKHGGPERARSWKHKPLMRNYEICSVGLYTGLNKDQLVSLLELCGSTTVQHPTLFPFDVGNQYFTVVQQNCNHTQEDYDALYKKYRVPVISREWVLDCIATYMLQPVDEYLLSGDQQPVIELDSDLEEVKL